MKTPVVVGVVMLSIGFALGWVAKPERVVEKSVAGKPAGVSKDAQISAAPAAADEALATKSGHRETTAKSDEAKKKEEQQAQVKKMQSEMSKALAERVRGKFEKQIEKLAESLNLTTDQKASLTAWLDERMKKFEEMDFSNPASMKDMEETMKGISNKAMEDQLAVSLSPEQKTALDDFKEKELRDKVDTLALKNLSKLQSSISFEEGQRDRVYEILADNAEKKAAAEEGAQSFTAMMTEGMGMDTDPYDLGLQGMMEQMGKAHDDGSPMTDQKEMARQMRKSIDETIDAKVEQLRPVLNEKQLDQYRNELKTNGLGFLGPMLNAMDGGAVKRLPRRGGLRTALWG